MKYSILSVLWMIVIWIGSSIPGSNIPGDLSYVSYLIHLTEFAVLGFLLIRGREYRKEVIFFALIIGALYGVVDEAHQSFVPGRSVDIFDWLMDAWGVMMGIWAGVRFRFKIKL